MSDEHHQYLPSRITSDDGPASRRILEHSSSSTLKVLALANISAQSVMSRTAMSLTVISAHTSLDLVDRGEPSSLSGDHKGHLLGS